MPNEGSIVAISGALLVQVPRAGVDAKPMDDPTHTCVGPVIAEGAGLTVTTTDV